MQVNTFFFSLLSTCTIHLQRYQVALNLLSRLFVDYMIIFFSADSPVLWLRIDPDMQVLRKVQWEQPDYMWQYQLRHERDVVAQSEVHT